ncbi:MAG TPA: acetate--CoA ligase family protein [Burkholderiales bacterium]|nr:acetate--CoA ligase family protein [Burkholderiales bacterium]
MSSFSRLLNPRGVAIVGATDDTNRAGGQALHAISQYGYAGGIFPVNPKYDTLGKHRCYRALAGIDQPCDVAVVAVPAAHVPGVIEQCGLHGIPFAVVLGGGFREAGPEGIANEQRMLEAARKGGVRLIGPNCLGFVNIHQRVYAGFGSITKPPVLKPGPVSAVIQSGGFGNSLVVQTGVAGVGFRYVVASGNESDIKAPELINAFVDDPETKVILAYLEGVADGRGLMAAARRALAAGKPVIILKAGNTQQGLRAAASHTANLTSSYDVFSAALKQCGVIEVHDTHEAADYAQCFAAGRQAQGRNVVVMGGSGGSAVAFSDAADEVGLKLIPLAAKTMTVLRENLPNVASLENPVDYAAGFINDKNAPRFQRAIDAILADPDVHQLGVLLATSTGRTMYNGAAGAAQALKKSDKPVMLFCSIPYSAAPEGFDVIAAEGIPMQPSPRRVAYAMGRLADYNDVLNQRERICNPPQVKPRILPPLPAGAVTLDELESKKVLRAFGVPVTHDVLVKPGAALPASVTFPVAVKVASRDIAHKSDIGGVRLNVQDAAQLEQAITEVLGNAKRAVPQANIAGTIVAEMITDGLETIVGVVNDACFGPVVAFGLGGILAETIRDVTYRVAPFDKIEAHAMVREIRGAKLFDGVRGQPARDVDALVKLLVAVSEMAWLLRERVTEMDINPVLVRPAGKGVIAADALIVLK